MLSQTIAIVAGGSSGLGAATAKHLLRLGARVCVADLGSQKDEFVRWAEVTNTTIVKEGLFCDTGPAVTFAATDVTNAEQVNSALDHIELVYGEPLNAAINCAGIAVAKKTLSKKGTHPLDDFTKVVMVNMIGSFNISRLAAERMSTRTEDTDGLRGCVINTASIAAYEGQIGQVAYAASKGGVVGMTLPMARDLASYGIRVMAIVSIIFAEVV
jgi:3-hydroxyacyl-CoA dehydrogenase / 3-hydroxy-2-methylbutyryl-CoA dehydrogenase